jgi:hypothetical protein
MNNETEILRQIANEFKDLAAKYDYDFSIKDRRLHHYELL